MDSGFKFKAWGEIPTDEISNCLKICVDPGRTCFWCVNKGHGKACVDELMTMAAYRLQELDDYFVNAEKMVQDDIAAHNIMQRAIDTYGRQAQIDVAIEEMAELTKALLKTRRVSDDDHDAHVRADIHVIEEIADVEIMIDQLKIMYGEPHVDAVRKQKLVRLEARMEDKP